MHSARQRPVEYESTTAKRSSDATSKPSGDLSQAVKDIGIRELIRLGLGRRILEKISRPQPIRTSTLHEYERRIRQYLFDMRKAAYLATESIEEEPNSFEDNCGEMENDNKAEVHDAEQAGHSAANAPAPAPGITEETKETSDRCSSQESSNTTPAQELPPEAEPETRRGWKWILGGAVGLLIVLGFLSIVRRLESHSTRAAQT